MGAASLLRPGCFPRFGVRLPSDGWRRSPKSPAGPPLPLALPARPLLAAGRRSRKPRTGPPLALDSPARLLVSPVRGSRSQWLANSRGNPAITFCWRGRESSAYAHVLAGENDRSRLPADLRALGSLLAPSIF